MANISEFILPVLNQETGEITMTAFNLLAGSPEGIGFGYGAGVGFKYWKALAGGNAGVNNTQVYRLW